MDTRETRGANLKSHIKSKAMSQRAVDKAVRKVYDLLAEPSK